VNRCSHGAVRCNDVTNLESHFLPVCRCQRTVFFETERELLIENRESAVAASLCEAHRCNDLNLESRARREQRNALLASGDNSAVAPPVPIPNTEVKRCSPDGSTATGRVRVGRRQNKMPARFSPVGIFFYVLLEHGARRNAAYRKRTEPLGTRHGREEVNTPSWEAGG
jgi:hypothetical protein